MSVYVDGATNLIQTSSGGWICLITNVAAGVNGAITIDRRAFAGTAPSSSVNARSVNVGGCWQGPYRTISFPFSFLATTATNGTGIIPRANFKNSATYAVTAAMTHSLNGPIRFQGYSSSPGDGSRATLDGGTAVSGYVLFTASGNNNDFEDLIFSHNGNSASSAGVTCTAGARNMFRRCVVNTVRGIGFNTGNCILVECEVYNANTSNTAATGAFTATASGVYVRCISHDNSGTGSSGFKVSGSGATVALIDCISSGNIANGALITAAAGVYYSGDLYSNTGAGMEGQADGQLLYIENCNILKSTTFGITNNGVLRNGATVNLGFGSGSEGNNGGDLVVPGGINQVNNFSYAAGATPWVNGGFGDFRIILPAAKAVGRGSFTDTELSAGTVGFPDVGAAQSASTNGGFGATFAQ